MNLHHERLDGVSPVIRGAVMRLCDLSELKLKRPLLIVHGWRSMAQQVAIYQQGRAMNRETGEWDIVDARAVRTNAKPGTSAHNVVTKREGNPAASGDPASANFPMVGPVMMPPSLNPGRLSVMASAAASKSFDIDYMQISISITR